MSPNLFRIRNAVRAVLALGVAASVAANVLHAQPTIVGRAIAAWSPLALLLTVELISRVPVYRRSLSGLRMAATGAIAGIAAWVSYWHMAEVALRNGESTTSAHLLPLSVDGLVVVASISLVEIGARIHAAADVPTAKTPAPEVAASPVEPEAAAPVPATQPAAKATPAAPVKTTPNRTRKPAGQSTAVRVARLRERHPHWTAGQIAERAGVTERTVRRHLNAPASTTAPAATPIDEPVTTPDADTERAA